MDFVYFTDPAVKGSLYKRQDTELQRRGVRRAHPTWVETDAPKPKRRKAPFHDSNKSPKPVAKKATAADEADGKSTKAPQAESTEE